MKKRGRRIAKKLVGVLLASAIMLQSVGCGSEMLGGDQPGHGKWINSNLPENASKCAEIRLQDDFAAAANAQWNESQNFDPSETYSTLDDAGKIVRGKLREIFADESIKDPNVEKLRVIDGLYTDWDYRNQLGVEPLRKYLDYIDEIQSIEDVYEYMMDSSRNPFVGMLFKLEMCQTDHISLSILQPEYSLKTSSFYMNLMDDGLQQKDKVTRLTHYLLERLGESEDEVDELLDENFAFELKMAEINPGNENYVDYYTDVTLEDVKKNAGDFQIERILEHFGLDKYQNYTGDMDYLKGIQDILVEDNLEGIKAYFKIYLIIKSVSYLDYDALVEFLNVRLDQSDRYAEANVRSTDLYFFSELENSPLSGLKDQVYLDYYYDEEVAEDIKSMCEDYIKEYHEIIAEKDWLTDENKERIYQKIDDMHFLIMKPNNVADYSDVSFVSKEEGGSMLDAYCEISRFNLENMGRMCNEKLDRDYWNIYEKDTTTSAINSVYVPDRNAFFIDIGILNGEFYSKDMSYEEKLGAIGCVIGHELSHAFDSWGVRFDSQGKENDLLVGDDMKTFKKMSGDVADYFGEVRSFEGSGYYDGTNDITGEAIADMGGMKCSLRLAEKIDGFDYDKFFRSYASVWKKLTTKSDCVDRIKTDPHPLSYLRINITVQQFDEFYETYGIQEGDGMYLAPDDRIAIW